MINYRHIHTSNTRPDFLIQDYAVAIDSGHLRILPLYGKVLEGAGGNEPDMMDWNLTPCLVISCPYSRQLETVKLFPVHTPAEVLYAKYKSLEKANEWDCRWYVTASGSRKSYQLWHIHVIWGCEKEYTDKRMRSIERRCIGIWNSYKAPTSFYKTLSTMASEVYI